MVNANTRRKMEAHRYYPGRSVTQNKSALDSYELFSEKNVDLYHTLHLWYTMELQPHYFCPKANKSRTLSSILKGDVKACYVRTRRRWVRVGILCLNCCGFVLGTSNAPRERSSL